MPWSKRSDEETVQLGQYVRVVGVGDVTTLFVAGMPFRRLSRSDHAGLRLELAAFESMSMVTQAQVARSELVAEATFHRDCVAYRAGGARALLERTVRGAKGPRKLVPSVVKEIDRLHAQGRSNRSIGHCLGISESRVRAWLKRTQDTAATQTLLLPLTPIVAKEKAIEEPLSPLSSRAPEEAPPEEPVTTEVSKIEVQRPASVKLEIIAPEPPQPEPKPSKALGPEPTETLELEATEVEAIEAEVATTAAAEPVDECAREVAHKRREEWILARLGKIEEQSALFPPVEHARYAGVLLGISLLSVTGLIETVRETLGPLKNGYYGVRSILTTLVAMALLRCKRPEQLKGFDPTALGAVVGLSRAPEMKTLRRKLKKLAQHKDQVLVLMRKMAERHVNRVKEAMAFLYIDGHVRPYFGDKVLSKTHVAAMRISLPATTDYWVSDARGEPILVVTTEGNAAMTQVLPGLLEEVRTVVGPDAKPTVVFDRGGYSPALFQRIIKQGFHFITYRKGKYDAFAAEEFESIFICRGGTERAVRVCDRRIDLPGYGVVRCVAVLRSDGKQTHVLTSRDDSSTREVLERMFARWQQENFFKYLGESFAFDALWTYATDEADPQRTVPNPERRALNYKLAILRRQIARQKEALGVQVLRTDSKPAQEKPSQQVHAIAPIAEIAELESQVAELLARRKALPERVAVGTLRDDGKVLELARAPMLLGDLIKMTAFHLESMLLTAVAPYLARAEEEGRAFLADVMQLDGRLSPQPDHLLVTLKSPSAPRYHRALDALCQHLNAQNVAFPETSLRLQFNVAAPPEPPV